MKYRIEAICPISMNGGSTGCPPIQVSTSVLAIKSQNSVCVIGRRDRLRCLEVCRVGIIIRIKIDASRAITPPSLFGIDRKIAYANKKYHSGWMCGGVINGLAGVKFSGSPRRFGVKSEIIISVNRSRKKPKRSLKE